MDASDSQLTLKMCQLTCSCFLLPSMADNCSAGCEQKLTTCRSIACWLSMRQAGRNGQVTYHMYCMYSMLARLWFFMLELVDHPCDFCVMLPAAHSCHFPLHSWWAQEVQPRASPVLPLPEGMLGTPWEPIFPWGLWTGQENRWISLMASEGTGRRRQWWFYVLYKFYIILYVYV